jgi:hypothetical protein
MNDSEVIGTDHRRPDGCNCESGSLSRVADIERIAMSAMEYLQRFPCWNLPGEELRATDELERSTLKGS